MNSIKWIYISGFILLSSFYFFPFAWLKLLAGLFLFILCDAFLSYKSKIIAAQVFIIFLFLSTFIMTPFSHALSNILNLGTNGSYYIFGIIVCSAIGWIYTIIRFYNYNNLQRENEPKPYLFKIFKQYYPFIVLSILVTLLIKPTIDIDFSYGGDEHYHAFSIVICQHLFLAFANSPLRLLLLFITIALICLFYANKQLTDKPVVSGVIVAIFVFVFGLCWFYTHLNIRLDNITIERSLRYPCSEPWVSAILGFLDFSYLESFRKNGINAINDFGVMRLLPSFSYLLFGYLIYKRLMMKLSTIISAIVALTFLTIPIILYESTLLYLEMPLVVLSLIVLMDSEKILTAPPDELPNRLSFYALISLQFLKESGVVIAITLVLLRLLYRFKNTGNPITGNRMFTLLKSEIPLIFVSTFGGLLYLCARSLTPYRPYNFHPENLLNLDLWGKGLWSLIQQYHLFVILLIPAVIYIVQRQAKNVITCVVVGSVVWLFFFLEEPRWIGLARFNLLIAPALITLGIVMFTYMYEKTKTKYLCIFLFVLLILNVINIPFMFTGYRKDWGGSGERWYNWSQCLFDIKQVNDNASIIVANMPYKYGFGLVFAKLNWIPNLKEEKPLIPQNEIEDFKASLNMFKHIKADFLIYRYESLFENDKVNVDELIKQRNLGMFRKYPSAVGGLIVLNK